jgi:hypothetical protein
MECDWSLGQAKTWQNDQVEKSQLKLMDDSAFGGWMCSVNLTMVPRRTLRLDGKWCDQKLQAARIQLG